MMLVVVVAVVTDTTYIVLQVQKIATLRLYISALALVIEMKQGLSESAC